MTEVVNLRQARKVRARSRAAREAERNRAKFGCGKAARETTRREAERIAHMLDLTRRDSAKDNPE